MVDQSTRVGLVGIGTIGKPMALNIRKGGFPLAVFDFNQQAVADLIEAGAEGKATPAEVAAVSDVVVTMVPDAPDVEKAALSAGGIIEGLREGAVYIDMSTVDPATSRKIGAEMAKKGIRMIDAPVGRSVDHAYRGELAIMMGGDEADVEEVMPILRCMGSDFTYCGPLGSGHAMKLTNNYIACGILSVLSEALSFGMASGLKLEKIIELVGSTGARSGILLDLLPSRAFKDDFGLGFKATLAQKDVRLGLKVAEENGLDAPVGNAVFETLKRAIDEGYGDDDFTSVLRVNESRADVRIRFEDHGGRSRSVD